MTYYLSADQESIKLTNVSGSWECMNDDYTMSFNNSEVMLTDGTPGFETEDNTLRRYPETRSFSYDTGWDFVMLYPNSSDAMTGPRSFSETTASIDGMGGSYDIFVFLEVLN